VENHFQRQNIIEPSNYIHPCSVTSINDSQILMKESL